MRAAASPAETTGQAASHPLLEVLPHDVRAVVLARGRRRVLSAGTVLSDEVPMVRFVLAGAIGSFAAVDFLCLGYFGPGAVVGLETAVEPRPASLVQAITSAEVFELPAQALTAAAGPPQVERLLGLSAARRLPEAERELVCLATHGVGRRLARWLLRLHRLAPGEPIAMSQERLAQLLGAQRTSVNAAAHPLQRDEIVRYRRGRICVLDEERLVAAACDCLRPAAGAAVQARRGERETV